MVLWLWGGAVEPLGDLLPFLLQMDGLMFMESDSGSKLSRVVDWNSPNWEDCTWKILSALKSREFLFLPFIQIGQYCGQGGEGIWTLSSAA